MRLRGSYALVSNELEFSVVGRQSYFLDAFNLAFALEAVFYKFCERGDFKIMFFAEFEQLRHTRHRAVFVHNFADDACRLQACQASEVDGTFGLTCAD